MPTGPNAERQILIELGAMLLWSERGDAAVSDAAARRDAALASGDHDAAERWAAVLVFLGRLEEQEP